MQHYLGFLSLKGDIQNAYLQAPSSEKHFIVCGPEFGAENVGRVALTQRALYGRKVAGRDFWHHLRECMGRLGFTSSRADPDVWFRLSKRSTGEEYYEYVLLYVANVLVISEKAEAVLRKEIGKDWILKEESIGPPSKYLGGKLREVTLESGLKCWAFGSCQYVQSAVNNVVDHLRKKGNYVPDNLRQKGTKLPAAKLPAAHQAKQGLLSPYNAPNPLSSGYRPELDVTPELGEADA